MSEQEHTLVSKESINTFREVLERYDILFSDISWDAMSFVLRHFLWRNVQRHPALYQDMFNEDDVVQVFEDRILTSLEVMYNNGNLPVHDNVAYDKIVQLIEALFAKDGDNVVDAIHVLLDALTGDGSLDDGAVHTQFVTDNPDAMSVAPSLVDDNGDADDDDDADAQPVTDEPSDETPERPRDQWADVSVDVDASQDKPETIEPEIINPADISVVLYDAIDDDDGSDDDSDDDIPDIVVGASLSEPEPVIESVVQEPVQEPVTVHTLSMPATPQVPTMHRANMPSSAPSTSLSYDAQPVHRGRHAAPIVNDNTSKHVDVNKTASDAGLDIDGTGHTSVNDSTVRDNVDDYASFVKLLADRKIDEALALARATNRADMLQMIELVRGEERERQAAKHYDDVKSIVSDVTADVLADTKDPHVEAMLDAKTQDGDAKTGRDGDSEQLAGTFGFQSTIDMLDDDDDDDDDDDLNIGLYTGASSIIDMDDDDEPDDVMSQSMNEPDDALADDKTVSVDERALDTDASGSTGDADGVSDVMPDDDAGDDTDDTADDDDTDDDDDIIVEPSAGMDEQARLGVQHSDVQSDMHNAVVVSDVSHVIDVEPVAQVGESNSDDGKSDDADGGDVGNDKNDNNDVDAQHGRIEGDDMDEHDADAQHVVQDMPQHDKREVAPSDDDNFVNEFDTLLYEDDPVHSPITTLIDAVDGVRDDDTSKQALADASNDDISNDVFADDMPDDINDEPLDDAPVGDVPDDISDTVPDDIPDDIPEDMPDDIDADLPPVQHDDDDFDDTDDPDDTDDTDGDDDMPQDGMPDAQSDDDDVPFGQDEPSDDDNDDNDDNDADDSAGVDDIPQTTPASTDASHDASVHDEPDVDADGHDDEHDDVDTPSQVASQPQQTVVTNTTQLELEPVAAPVGYKDTDAVVHQQNMLDILAGLDIDLSNTGHVSVGPFAGTDNKLDKASTVKNPRSVLAKPRRSDSDSDSDSGSGNNDGNGGRQVSPETLARFKRKNNDSGTGGRSLARNSDAAAGNANVQQATAQNNVDPQYDDDAVF